MNLRTVSRLKCFSCHGEAESRFARAVMANKRSCLQTQEGRGYGEGLGWDLKGSLRLDNSVTILEKTWPPSLIKPQRQANRNCGRIICSSMNSPSPFFCQQMSWKPGWRRHGRELNTVFLHISSHIVMLQVLSISSFPLSLSYMSLSLHLNDGCLLRPASCGPLPAGGAHYQKLMRHVCKNNEAHE